MRRWPELGRCELCGLPDFFRSSAYVIAQQRRKRQDTSRIKIKLNARFEKTPQNFENTFFFGRGEEVFISNLFRKSGGVNKNLKV